MIVRVRTSDNKIKVILENGKTYEFNKFEQLTDFEYEIIHNFIITAKHSVSMCDGGNLYFN